MRAIPQPNYGVLTAANIQLVLTSTGLIGGTNRFGTVGATGNITTWSGIRPGVTGRDFAGFGNLVKRETANGIAVIGVSDKGTIRSSSSAATWDFMSHNAVFANIKWTVHMLCRIGFGTQPGDFLEFFGNNGRSQFSKGVAVYGLDINGFDMNLAHAITKGTSGAISTSADNNQIVGNEWAVYTFTFDGALAASLRFKAYKNKVQLTTTVTSASTTTVATPAFALEFFGAGNQTAGVKSCQVSHIVIQNIVESIPTQDAFIDSLEPYRLALNANPNNQFHPYSLRKDDGTKYYQGVKICQNPVTPSTVVKIFTVTSNHVQPPGDIATIYIQKSTDYGRTFGAEAVFYNTGSGTVSSGDMGGGYDSLGRLWMFVGTLTLTGIGLVPYGQLVIHSDDDGATTVVTDITSIMPADGLTAWNPHGQLIETSTGRLLFQVFKYTAGSAAQSANYCFFSDDRSTWGIKTIRAIGTEYRNEAGAFLVSDGVTEKIIIYLRDDDTNEWHVYSSTDDGDTFVDDGAETLGVTLVNAGPVCFEKYVSNGSGVVVGYFATRDVEPYTFKAIYGLAGSFVANSHAFDVGTLIDIMPSAGYHYSSVCHPTNSLFAIGLSCREPNPLTNTENDLVTFFMPTWQEGLIKQELGV